MALVGDSERERTAATLSRHFVEGRISVEELGARTELALGARSRSELRTALHDLPKPWHDGVERIASAAAAARRGLRLVALILIAGAWAVMTLALAIALAVALAVFGSSPAVLAAFAVVWAAVSLILLRPWFHLLRRP
jgi:hypothetical protein